MPTALEHLHTAYLTALDTAQSWRREADSSSRFLARDEDHKAWVEHCLRRAEERERAAADYLDMIQRKREAAE